GAEVNPPGNLDRVPDAEPRVEPIRIGGPNKPYEILGNEYVPITQDRGLSERGLASWYGVKFHGKRTSSGEPYDMYAMTAAHPTMPIPSYARVRNPANGREIVVRINDRGPFHKGRVIDLSYTAALKLGVLRGVAPVEIERITFDEIRAGTWRRANPADPVRVASASAATSALASASPAASAFVSASTAPTTNSGLTSSSAPPLATSTSTLPAASTALRSGPDSTSTSEGLDRATAVTPAGQPEPDLPTRLAAESTRARGSALPSMPVPVAGASTTSMVPIEPAVPQPASNIRSASDGFAVASDDPRAAPSIVASQRGFWVQLGAFRQRSGATDFQRRVPGEFEWLSPLLAVFTDASLFRLQAGPYESREQARGAADSIRAALQLVPVIVERR
ncbi:MAG: septal ring lytic transglycosylase RlpA family protein, partial [Caldimonas sp.]